MHATVTLPSTSRLAMWPYHLDDEQLFSLNYAAQVSDMIAGNDDYDGHDIWGWLFSLCSAYYAVATCTEAPNGLEILDKLDAMQFRMSPLFRGQDDLEETDREVFEILTAQN